MTLHESEPVIVAQDGPAFFRGETTAQNTPDSQITPRKLVRTGQVTATLDDYDPFREELELWLSAHGGFIADTMLDHHAGDVSWGTLQIRVPGDQLDALMHWTETRVEIQSMSTDTQDVTEQWTDLDARLTNLQRSETRLAALLEHETTDLTEVLAVERELSRVRGELESLEGRLRVLNNQVELSSLTLSLSVRTPYTPALKQPLLHEAGDALSASLQAMQTTGRGLVIAVAALSPWLALSGALLGMLFGIARRFSRSHLP